MAKIQAITFNNSTWKLLLAFALFAVAISMAGYTIFDRYKERMKSDEQLDLGGIAELKTRQLTNWMAERKGDAQALKNDPLFLDETEHWLQQGGPAGTTKNQLIGRLASLQLANEIYGYTSIALLDDRGRVRLSTAADDSQIIEQENDSVQKSMNSGQIIFSDIHQEQRGSAAVLEIDLVTPLIVNHAGRPHTMGVALFHIDPQRFLFPLIQRWPTPSPSAETLLIRRDGDEVVFVNTLRHVKNIPLSMRIPYDDPQFLARQAVMGQDGLLEGKDYRNVPVVGIANRIADTPWIMIAKIDRAEIFAPINQLANWMVALMVCLVGAGGGVAVLLRQQDKRLHRDELERHALEKHLNYLSKYANDIILLHDATGKIIDFNDRAIDAYGYTASELPGINFAYLRAIEFTPPLAQDFDNIDLVGALRFESMHVRRNGVAFPVECSVRRVDIGGEKFYQAIIRDISERKAVENALALSEKRTRLALSASRLVLWDYDLTTGKVYLSEEWAQLLGGEPQPTITTIHELAKQVPEEEQLMVKTAITEAVKAHRSSLYQVTHRVRKFDGEYIWLLSEGEVVERGPDGLALRMTGTNRDITERKQAEKQLLQQKIFLHQVIDTDPNLIYVKDADGKFLMVNQALANFYGVTMQRMIGKTEAEITVRRKGLAGYFEPDIGAFKNGREIILAESSLTEEGKQHWYLTIKKPLPQTDGSLNVLGIAVDITSQKLLEIKQTESYKELQRLTAHLESVKEEERLRIARELHDEMGATLAAIKMRVAWLSSKLPPQMPLLSEETAHISELVTDGIHTLRQVVSKLRPSLLEDVGFDAAIEDCVRQFRHNTNIECILSMPDKGLELETEQSSAIFRILQESLNNVSKHAHASKVNIQIARKSNSLLMLVEDNGQGFPQKQNEKSFGLLGIRERALMAGGKAKISSVRGKGTRVAVSVPTASLSK